MVENKESEAIAAMLDSRKKIADRGQYEELKQEECQAVPATQQEITKQDDWSELKAPKVELKPLPHGVMYAFLGPNETYPVIVSSELTELELSQLLNALKSLERQLGTH